MTRLLHYVPQWLAPTEGFVRSQIQGSSYRSVVVTCRLVPGTPRDGVIPLGRLGSDRAARLALPVLRTVTRSALVHVHFGYRLRDVRGLLGRVPVVVSLHGHDVTAFAREWPSYYRGVLDRVDAVVVPSHHLERRVLELGARPDRVHVVPAGVDLRFFRPAPLRDGPPTVLFIGRLVEKKGVDVLVSAWPAVRAALPDARLRVVGDGPLAAVVAAGTPGIERVGSIDRAGVRDEIWRAGVVCTPSRTAADGDEESLLLVNLEAQACGRPVVTTRHGGIPEFVMANRSGLLVPEGDAQALAAALVRILTEPALAQRLGATGPEVASRFDADTCATRVDDEVYRPLLGGAR